MGEHHVEMRVLSRPSGKSLRKPPVGDFHQPFIRLHRRDRPFTVIASGIRPCLLEPLDPKLAHGLDVRGIRTRGSKGVGPGTEVGEVSCPASV